LSQSYEFIEQSRVKAVYIKASVNITETITITRVSRNGSSYNVLLDTKTLNSESNYIFHPEWDLRLLKGDSILVQCTNANTTGTVYGTIHIEGGVK
jgi:hypothetical protein